MTRNCPSISLHHIPKLSGLLVSTHPVVQKQDSFELRSLAQEPRRSEVKFRLHELTMTEAAVVDINALKEANIIPAHTQRVKVILSGEISEAVQTRGLHFTKGARAAVEAAGGKIEE